MDSRAVDTDPTNDDTLDFSLTPGRVRDYSQTPLVEPPHSVYNDSHSNQPGQSGQDWQSSSSNTFPVPVSRANHADSYPTSGIRPTPQSGISNAQPEGVSMSFFSGAHDLVINNPHIQNVINHFSSEEGALKYLLPYVCSGAAVDSSERDPPPLCHPGTRKGIQDRLLVWFDDPERQWSMEWISGPAGVGKTAIAQSFAETCIKKGRLGAAFFFSRPNERDRPNTVIPTLAFEMAMRFPDYKHLLIQRISSDPTILEKTRRIQFMELIIEPISTLQMQGHPITRGPLLVLLDGLDECQGIHAQGEFVEMIGEVVRSRKNLPLLWLICSRPEPHLTRICERPDFAIHCKRVGICLHGASQKDVDLFLRDGFVKLREEFSDTTDSDWPSRSQFNRVSKISSGLFVLASTIMKYLGDPEYANPMARLVSLLDFMQDAHQTGKANPLVALDFLYSMILAGVPNDILPTTKRILGHFMVMHSRFGVTSVQTLCNSLKIERSTFYAALRRLHSVITLPAPEQVDNNAIWFHHASFEDYLSNPSRSGSFAVDLNKARAEVDNFCPFTYEIDRVHIDPHHSTQASEGDIIHLLKTQVLLSRDRYQSLFRAKGASAQQILDILHKLLRSRVVDNAARRLILTAYLRLSAASRLLPRQLRLCGIKQSSVPFNCCHEGLAHEYKGEYHGHQVSLKMMTLHGDSDYFSVVEDIFHEAAIWSQLTHPNILQFYGIYHPPESRNQMGFVFPVAENGTLREYLNAHPDIPKLPIIHGVLAGLHYLHQHRIVHGHLSGKNILVRGDGSVCLTDFLPSSVVDADVPGLRANLLSTGYWTAPEVFKQSEEGQFPCSFKNDIYSLACVMLEVLSGEHPWRNSCCSAIKSIVTEGMIPDRPMPETAPELTDDIWAIMKECWNLTPSDRPTVEEIIDRLPGCTRPPSQDPCAQENSWGPEMTWTVAEMNRDKAFLMELFNFH